MYSKIVYGLALTAAGCHAAEIVRRDADGGGHAHGGGGHAHAPASGYEEPAASYGAPAASYGAPAASYGAPAASYGAPSTGYAEPSTGYGGGGSSYDAAPSYGGDGDILPFDLSALLIPILAIIGLSLLFPTITSVAVNGRRKRDLARDANPMTDVVERVNEIYNSVIQSEQCMERIACELGGIAGDVGLKESPMAKMADLFVTAKYKPYYKQFKSGRNCEKIKCGSLPF